MQLISTATCDGAQVASQRCSILHAGFNILTNFGEIAKNYEDGELVDLEGSWEAGVDGAKAGIIMKADPQVGDVYRQEFFLGDAEDMGEVLSLSGDETVPAADCDNECLVTKDYTPIEPDVEENKYYAPGVGPILEVDVETGERVELVNHILLSP